MFTWICPQCGREVPPSETECPDCASRKAVPEQGPSQSTQPAAKPRKRQRVRTPREKKELPGWVLSLIFALGFMVLGLGGFLGYRYYYGTGSGAALIPGFESPPAAAAADSEKQSTLAKYVEVTGFRLTEDAKQKVHIQFVVINHSGAEVADLTGTVTLHPHTATSDGQPFGSFPFKIASLGPYEAKDMKSEFQTNLRAYELPDWQFLRADVRITSP
jgi:hypothetical protein